MNKLGEMLGCLGIVIVNLILWGGVIFAFWAVATVLAEG